MTGRRGLALLCTNNSWAALAILLTGSMETMAAENTVAEFNLPEQALSSSLDALTKQTHTKLIYADSAIQGLRAHALKGCYNIADALNLLLQSSGMLV